MERRNLLGYGGNSNNFYVAGTLPILDVIGSRVLVMNSKISDDSLAQILKIGEELDNN